MVTESQIRIYGDSILRKEAQRVEELDATVQELIETMVAAMRENRGVGLAAPQVGSLSRVIVARAEGEDDSEIFCLINPRLLAGESSQEGMEGCLSLPSLRGEVPRANIVVVDGLTPAGDEVTIEAEGLLARVLQHEIDHLDGVLFVDHATSDSLYWLIPDPDAEDGYRREETAMEEAEQCFARLRAKRQAKGGSQQ